MDQLTMFGMNIFLLIGLAMLLAIIGVVLFVVFVGLRIWRFQRQQAIVEQEFAAKLGKKSGDGPARAAQTSGAGEPVENLPPMAQGICNACGKVFPMVFHLPSGERFCKMCFSKRPANA